jgi:hypothetical protein
VCKQMPEVARRPSSRIDLVQPGRQQRVGGIHIGIAPVPADQRHLVQRRRAARGVGERRPAPARRPESTGCASGAGPAPGSCPHRTSTAPGSGPVAGPMPAARHRPFGIHVQRQHAKAERPWGPASRSGRAGGGFANGGRSAVRRHPASGTNGHEPCRIMKPGQPVHPEARGLVAGPCQPQRHIRLIGQQRRRAVGAGVVHDQEMPHAQAR